MCDEWIIKLTEACRNYLEYLNLTNLERQVILSIQPSINKQNIFLMNVVNKLDALLIDYQGTNISDTEFYKRIRTQHRNLLRYVRFRKI